MLSQSSKPIFHLCSIALFLFTVAGATRVPSAVRPVSIERYPSTVRITDIFGLHLCAGSLVSQQFVLTAAHCLEQRYPEEILVIAGSRNLKLDNKGVKLEVENLWLHPQFKEDMDIAVIKLKEPVKRTKQILPIQMCSKPLEPKQSVNVVGWGQTPNGGERYADYMRALRIPVLPHEECAAQYNNSEFEVTENMICAGREGYEGACEGDAGGPVILRGKLCAIVSDGEGCADKTHPRVFTSIPAARNFIDQCMKL